MKKLIVLLIAMSLVVPAFGKHKEKEKKMAFNYATFDGSTGYIIVPSAGALNLGTGDFTITGVTQFGSVSGDRTILCKTASFKTYYVYLTGAKLFIIISDMALSQQRTFYCNISLLANTTYFWAIVMDSVGDAATFYINGTAYSGVKYVSTGSWPNTDNSGGLNIGRYTGFGSYLSASLLDDLRIYKKALSAEEITAIYNGGNGTTCQASNFPNGTDGFYMTFNETFSGTTVYGHKVVSGVESDLNGTYAGGVTQVSGGVPFNSSDDEEDDSAIALDDNYDSYTKFINKTGKRIQFRFKGSGGEYNIRGYALRDTEILHNR